MRNNQDRLGNSPPGGEEPPIQQTQQSEQTLQFVTPTEFVDLPSRGYFYPEGHPLSNAETIEIRHMTAKDEDILTSRSLLKKGVAIDRFLQNIIVDRSIKIPDLLIGDKNAIIVASRISGYGPDYQTSITCPSCNATFNHTFDLNECKINAHDTYKNFGVSLTQQKTFVIHVDKLDVDVEVKLLTSRDEATLAHLQEKRRKNRLPESNLTDQLRVIITSVGGNSDVNYINSFIQHLPAIDSRKLRNTYQSIVPNIDMMQAFVCPECDCDGEVGVPFGANFFWPR